MIVELQAPTGLDYEMVISIEVKDILASTDRWSPVSGSDPEDSIVFALISPFQ